MGCVLMPSLAVYKGVLLFIGIVSFFKGLFLIRAPKKAIEWQMALYRHINWKMEPLDWPREIRSTRVMGWTALVCGVAIFCILLARR